MRTPRWPKRGQRPEDLIIECSFTRRPRARKERETSIDLKLPAKGVREAALSKGHRPFHWRIEVSRGVLAGESRSSIRFVGNPPFVGGKKISTNYGDAYTEWLATLRHESGSNADLAHAFFRRRLTNFVKGRHLRTCATKIPSPKGDARAAGLRWICASTTGT
jgi:hypothetical protein